MAIPTTPDVDASKKDADFHGDNFNRQVKHFLGEEQTDIAEVLILEKNSVCVVANGIDPIMNRKQYEESGRTIKPLAKTEDQIGQELGRVFAGTPFPVMMSGENCPFNHGDLVYIMPGQAPKKLFTYRNVRYIVYELHSVLAHIEAKNKDRASLFDVDYVEEATTQTAKQEAGIDPLDIKAE